LGGSGRGRALAFLFVSSYTPCLSVSRLVRMSTPPHPVIPPLQPHPPPFLPFTCRPSAGCAAASPSRSTTSTRRRRGSATRRPRSTLQTATPPWPRCCSGATSAGRHTRRLRACCSSRRPWLTTRW